jgi:hypothetical protein
MQVGETAPRSRFSWGRCADSLCREFSVIGLRRIVERLHRVDWRESRLEGYTADTRPIKGANCSSLSPPLLLVEWLSVLDFNCMAP